MCRAGSAVSWRKLKLLIITINVHAITVDLLRLKLWNTCCFFYSFNMKNFSTGFSLAQRPIFHNRSIQSHFPNIDHCHLIVLTAVLKHCWVSKMTTAQIAEVAYILIRIVSTFLKMKRMLTETVLTPEKSTMKHITYYLKP